MKAAEKFTQYERAEDVLLGALGFGEDATIITVTRIPDGYRGKGKFSDGEEFDFVWQDELDDLQEWALGTILHR